MQISKQQILNVMDAAVSAAIGGAAVAVCDYLTEPQNMDWKHLKTVAITGAVLGLAQHYRTPPTVRAQQAMLLQKTPAGQVAQASNAIVEAAAATVQAEAEQIKENPNSMREG